MNILSVNSRGLGRDDKVEWIREIKRSQGVSFIALQETQFRDLSDFNIGKYWGPTAFRAKCVEANGRSRGTLCVTPQPMAETSG
ncbi:putative Endonuclease/exonuclease/phosphatase superfamily [Helianthus annuus]|uniref:Endonuclease/exonuclease/phosphatase superfamily n=1 Tax=Helianthus annuus TaxID=4232 RepID=A0A251S0J3_HELAN|nr:putative Endonuclease/exonuclease/phosphatase superfamily [Helianthus annuus]KAJ0822072.1 putative Endonuclease/exonuclease/phosphatase superfamily [Helianthus annuus]